MNDVRISRGALMLDDAEEEEEEATLALFRVVINRWNAMVHSRKGIL
jgi:hypothetical protein